MLNTGGMTTLLLPFHQDERVSDQSIVLESATPVVPDLRGDNQWRRLQTLYDALGDEVATSLGDGDVTVVTGDCLALLGTLAGVQRSGLDPAIVWFDAHGDVHTIESSTSGYLGGMALRMALGGNADALAGPLGLRPVAASKAVLVDARDLDPAEVEYLADSPVGQFQVEAITAAELPPGPVILHVDLDVIDCSEVPGLRFPAPQGPSSDDVLNALQRLLGSGQVVALDVACPWFEPENEQQMNQRTELPERVLALR